MAGAAKFEELIAWQKARELTKRIYAVTRSKPLKQDYGLCDQMRRASVSIMSNVVEGFERVSPAEFIRFLLIARASCGELRNQLYIAFDVGYLTEEDFKDLMREAQDVARTINTLRSSIDRRHKPAT